MLKLDFHIFKHLTNNTMKKLLLLLLIVPMVSFGQISNNYWEKLNEVNNSNNSNNSVLSATKTEISNLTAVDYFKRGMLKFNLKDYYGAIADYTKAIEVYSHIYVNASLEYPPFPSDAYYNRGISKENLGDLNGACKDWRKMKFLLEAQHLSIQKKCL